ncbi:MAG TPA: RpiB/LacA/LacB family sugar-phosphate isomerase [Bryocella sp.]|nr:RpiB/LacA/LacB family sugar-phosphate isomerase [Bryocella sp.]
MRIAIASDDAGLDAKQHLAAKLSADGHEVLDVAPQLQEEVRPDYAEHVALSVLRHDAERGVIISSRGVGASVAANRVPGVRAALCNDAYSAHVGAKNEGMNVLVLAVHNLDDKLAEEIVEAYLSATLAPIEVVGGLPPRRLQRVFSHVRENISRDLSVTELAQVVGMSQYYFSKLFKMSTGTTPHQYVMRQRVDRAQEVLRESQTALAEVAKLVGFETQSHFTSVFRKLVGTTPKHYREMHQLAPQASEDSAEKAATAA